MARYELSEKWIKASVTGTLWAASEIVLGSFLHNLRIPFSGNILTGIGLVILISVSYTWQDRGLFWRAGVICAVMKTISPSAVIFGPVIAILSEALLLELTVRLFGRNLLGFVTGSMLAMSWNLVQRIVNLLIFYGLSIIELYDNLVELAKKQLQIQTDIYWLPLIFLLAGYCIMGLLSAVAGIRVGKKLQRQPKSAALLSPDSLHADRQGKARPEFRYSLAWLLMNVIMLVAALALLNYTGMVYWSSFITLVAVVWAIRYTRALRQLTKPGLWLFFVLITMVAAFVFSKVQHQSLQEGMLIGLQMNFRAIVVVMGFSVLGTELYNPVIRSLFLRTSFKQLPAALELSFESLPLMIAQIPDFKSAVKNPVSIIHRVLQHGDERLLEIKRRMNPLPGVSVITGAVGAGKSTFAGKVADLLQERGLKAGGILSVRLTYNDETTGYDILDLRTRETGRFLRYGNEPGKEHIGRFSIIPEGIEMGNRILSSAPEYRPDLIIVDEVGKLELRGRGWSGALQKLVESSGIPLLITVREGFEMEVIEKWHLTDFEIVKVEVMDPVQFADRAASRQEIS